MTIDAFTHLSFFQIVVHRYAYVESDIQLQPSYSNKPCIIDSSHDLHGRDHILYAYISHSSWLSQLLHGLSTYLTQRVARIMGIWSTHKCNMSINKLKALRLLTSYIQVTSVAA